MESQIAKGDAWKDIEAIIAQIDDNTRLLRLSEVQEIVGLKTTEIYRRMQLNIFPKPVKLGKRNVRWISNQITEWKKEAVREALLRANKDKIRTKFSVSFCVFSRVDASSERVLPTKHQFRAQSTR